MMVLEQQKIIRLALARIVPNKNISTKPQFCQVHLNWSNLILQCPFRSTYQRSKNLERSTSNVDLHYIYIFGRYIKTNKLTLNTSTHNIICILLFSAFPSCDLLTVSLVHVWCLAWLWLPGPCFYLASVWCTQPAPWHDTHLDPLPHSCCQLLPGPRPLCIIVRVRHITLSTSQPSPSLPQRLIVHQTFSPHQWCNDHHQKWSNLNICEWHDNIHYRFYSDLFMLRMFWASLCSHFVSHV